MGAVTALCLLAGGAAAVNSMVLNSTGDHYRNEGIGHIAPPAPTDDLGLLATPNVGQPTSIASPATTGESEDEPDSDSDPQGNSTDSSQTGIAGPTNSQSPSEHSTDTEDGDGDGDDD